MGDLDFDNDVDLDDYQIYNASLFTTGIDPESTDSYLLGDLDGDLDNDFADFLIFKNAFIADGGAPGALAFGVAVPEPSTTALMLIGLVAVVFTKLPRFTRVLPCLALSAIAMFASPAQAELVPVFSYSFPASTDGTNLTITDLSTTGNNATLDGETTLVDDRPAGFDSSLMSLTGSAGGHGATDAIDLLENSIIDDFGGYVMDVWLKWEGTYTDTRKQIDYAGTEFIRTRDSSVQFGFNDSAVVLSYPIEADEWYHVQGIFDTGTNETDAEGGLTGNAYLIVNDRLVDYELNVTKSSFGDSLDRAIGINRWAGANAADWNQGAIFNPSVSLGALPIPEPSTTALMLIGLGTVVFAKLPRLTRVLPCLALSAIAMIASPAQAELVPVFSYSFPASTDGTNLTITDLSTAGNNATLDGETTLVDDRPAGFDSSLMSLTGSAGGHGATDAIDLLENSIIDDFGGYVMDVWLKWEGTYTDTRKQIDYAGTEFIRTRDSSVQFGFNDSAVVLSYPIEADEWYHVQGIFDTGTNETDAEGGLTGNAYLIVNDRLVDYELNVTKSSFGDSLDRAIGINRWAGANAADWNQGAIFNPSVSLGALPIPEPSTMGLFAMAAVALCCRVGYRRVKLACFALALGLAALANTAVAQLTPVFEYSFPASTDGSVETVTDLSSAGNNATLDLTTTLVDDRPAGFDSSLMSLTGSAGGHGATDAIDLLDNSIIDDHGGFIMDVWVNWLGNYSDGRKILDYAGTESIRTFDGNMIFGLSNGQVVLQTPINANQWYHVQGVFESGGNQTDANGDLLGDAYLYMDGVVVDSAFGVTKTGFGDSLDRQIGINRWGGGGGEYNQGNIFNPSIYLGTTGEPMRLEVNTTTGEVTMAHTTDVVLGAGRDIDFYQITSADGELTLGTWTSLDDTGFGAGSTTGDYNGDGSVNLADYTIWRDSLGSTGTDLDADGNGDQVVDSADYTLWKDNFGDTGASSWAEAGILTENLIGESNLTGSTFFDSGTSVSLGELWNEASFADPTTDLVFQYHVVGESGLRTGVIDVVSGSLQSVTSVPEPSSLLILALPAVALLVMRRGSLQRTSAICLTMLSCLAVAGAAVAETTNDRVYLFGNSGGDGGANGVYVIDSADEATYDDEVDFSDLSGTAHDLIAWEYNGTVAAKAIPGTSSGPRFVSTSGRPLADSTPIGVSFDGTNDLLIGARLGLPQTTASSQQAQSVPPTSGIIGPFDYSGITRRGFDLWVNPDENSAQFGTAEQTVVADTSQQGLLISDEGTWVLRYSSTNIDSGVAVKTDSTDNGWSHVMVVYPNSGFAGGIMYVDGEAVAARLGGYGGGNDNPLVLGANTGAFDPGALEPDPVFTGGNSSFYAGEVDDMNMFVMGTSLGGTEYGMFDLTTDNPFVADALLGYGPADLTGDGVTNESDVTLFISNWGSTNMVNDYLVGDLSSRLSGDFNIDGSVDLDDWQVLVENYTGSGSLNLDLLLAGNAVPEPSSVALLALAGLATCGAIRRR
ncbi:PEP-CTERM motif protein [Aeoliella mucimassa]|uniref:PEP-CTERM motif protein n=2 Tax=Aeoliella mucimassa TaxID=2527972 RepID=A0A518AQ57_9BACT|nr:PEP-CTERM motif protein [Aeoliella mucimassa]